MSERLTLVFYFLEKVSPYMGGIGISSAVVSFNVALYYNTIIAWCLFYFVQVKTGSFVQLCFIIHFSLSLHLRRSR